VPDAVSRFICKSELFEFELTMDINIDLYPLKVGADGRCASSLHKHAGSTNSMW
jgi:hypothetical protein